MYLMASEKSIRMCVACRERFLQKTLLRLKIEARGVKLFDGEGRSFYLCSKCSKSPKIGDKVAKIKKLDSLAKQQVMEVITLWESQSKISLLN